MRGLGGSGREIKFAHCKASFVKWCKKKAAENGEEEWGVGGNQSA